jgi:diguanylate cyclase (GGDEF)-like protein
VGYIPLTILIIVSALLTLTSLKKLNRINESIVESDIPLQKNIDSLVESVYTQELYANRFLILQSPNMSELFKEEYQEFQSMLKKINQPLITRGIDTDSLKNLHQEYYSLFRHWFEAKAKNPNLRTEYNKKIQAKQKELTDFIITISTKINRDRDSKNRETSKIGTKAFQFTLIFGIIIIVISIVGAFLITRNIAHSIKHLKKSTGEIAKGNFDQVSYLKNQDELGELSRSFNQMAKRLKNLEEMYLDASPLTRLPGGVAIENVLKKRIASGNMLAFCLIDMDNFKMYNDHYGYAKGNKLIKNTAEIIEDACDSSKSSDNFIGHIGGDDFVVITSVDNYQKICDYIIKAFDKIVLEYYDKKDLQRGYIEGKSRNGIKMHYPIMTISIAVVTNQKKKFKHHVQVGEIAAELKNYAKSIPGSLYIVDRRKTNSKKQG